MTEHDIFAAAIKLTGDLRATYLAAACGLDVRLREQLEALLRAHDESGGLLPKQVEPRLDVTHLAPGQTAAGQASVGMLISGRYKLMEAIGEGGMGEVWVADQLAPIRRRVALKLIKLGMDSRSVLARFEAERQALALMDHPNIAKVFDAGTTDDGRPYFVMELVKGTPITDFCDARRMTAKQRLELFIPVCLAIQHAHTKGIIHRDIKPSNVLVALHDERPVPKVIDFGVAKAVGQQLTEKTLCTGFGNLVGTPAYMAPEQATFNQLDIDTRADVYALGVLLYELLAGSPPVEPERLKQAALDEILRLIRDEEPPRPSQRLSTSQAKASIAEVRHSDPIKLAELIRGELDWIVMRALEKDRNRRYETANGFAADVQRYLAGEPVQAVPPSTAYRLKTFARKNRVMLSTAAAFTVLLLAAVGVSSWLAVQAKQAEALAESRRIEAETNAKESHRLGQLFEEESNENLKGRFEAEMKAVDLQVDLDLAEFKIDSRVGLLRLAKTLNRPLPMYTRPTTSHQREMGAGPTMFMTLAVDLVARPLDQFLTAAVLTAGQHHASLLPPITHGEHKVLWEKLSPDGKSMATFGADATIRLWDLQTARQKAILRENTESLVNGGFSPDGKTLFTNDYDSIVRFWNASDGSFRTKTELRSSRFVYPEKISTDEIHIVAETANAVLLTDRLAILYGTQLKDVRVYPSIDGHSMSYARGTSGPAECYDVMTGRLIARLDRPGHTMENYSLSPDGRWITAIEDRSTVFLFSAENGRELARLPHPAGDTFYYLEVSPHGRRIVTCFSRDRAASRPGLDRIYRVWEAAPWRVVPDPTLDVLHNDSFVKFLNDDLLQVSHDNGIGEPIDSVLVRPGQNGYKQILGGIQIASMFDGAFVGIAPERLYDGSTLKRLLPPPGRKYPVVLEQLTCDGRFVFADGGSDLVDCETEKRINLNWTVGTTPGFIPGFGTVAVCGHEVRLLPAAKYLDFSPSIVQLWAQVAVRGELSPEGEFVKWDESTWEKKRQELAAIPAPHPDLPFPGYLATDKLHWLRSEYNSAPNDAEKQRLAQELLRRAEANGDQVEAIRWKAALAPVEPKADPAALPASK